MAALDRDAASHPRDHARIVPYADVMVLIDERNRLSAALEKAERECERLRGFPRDMVAWEDVEIGLRGVLSAAWAFDAAQCLKNLDWIVVRDA